MIHLLDTLLSRFRWYRKARGGHWERWCIDHPVCSDIWMSNAHGTRPVLGRGTPTCEHW